MNKFWFFFYGTPNILGLALMLLSLLLQLLLMIVFDAGVGAILLLPVSLLLYAAGWLVGWLFQPKNANLHFQNTLTSEEIENELKQLMRKIQGRVPPMAYEKVENIRQSVLAVLPQIVGSQVANQDLYTVKKTVFDYLPSTLENYLKLPAAYANMHTISDGKTAKELLIEQLTVIDDSLLKINNSIFSNDAQSLLANQRFLEQRLETVEDFI